MDKQEISVIIQGPIDDRTHESIDAFKDFGEIIVSTWDDQDLRPLKKASAPFKVAISSYPPNMFFVINRGAGFYQAETTLSGLCIAEKEWAIKTRTDEIYPDLSKFLENASEFPDRFHTTNNGFWQHIPYCFSNHLFLGRTKLMKQALAEMVKYCKREDYQDLGHQESEQMFGFFLMLALGHDLRKEDWRNVFRENVFITPCSELPNHLHSGCSYFLGEGNGFKRAPNYPEGRPDGHKAVHLYSSHTQI